MTREESVEVLRTMRQTLSRSVALEFKFKTFADAKAARGEAADSFLARLDTALEIAVDELRDHGASWRHARMDARTVALEEAATAAEDTDVDHRPGWGGENAILTLRSAAARIRALKNTSPEAKP